MNHHFEGLRQETITHQYNFFNTLVKMMVQQGKCWYSYVGFSFCLIHLAGITHYRLFILIEKVIPPSSHSCLFFMIFIEKKSSY